MGHYLLGLQGQVYEGRDWHFMGETNTAYDPGGHFLTSIIGNYERQEASPELLASIADLMAWALTESDLPLERIGWTLQLCRHRCPGTHLRKYLEDGTLKRMVQQRLARKGA